MHCQRLILDTITSSVSPIAYDSEGTIKMLRQTFSNGTIVRYSYITKVYTDFIGQ